MCRAAAARTLESAIWYSALDEQARVTGMFAPVFDPQGQFRPRERIERQAVALVQVELQRLNVGVGDGRRSDGPLEGGNRVPQRRGRLRNQGRALILPGEFGSAHGLHPL